MLDQFSRNIWRDTPRAFAQDAQALTLAQELVRLGQDRALPIEQRAFALFQMTFAAITPALMAGAWVDRARFGWVLASARCGA